MFIEFAQRDGSGPDNSSPDCFYKPRVWQAPQRPSLPQSRPPHLILVVFASPLIFVVLALYELGVAVNTRLFTHRVSRVKPPNHLAAAITNKSVSHKS